VDEREFNARADAMLAHIEALLEDCSADFDYEIQPGGVIELEFEHAGGSKIVINRHTAAQEIWIAAKSGGYHFKPDPANRLLWLGTRDDVELLARLSQCMSEQAGVGIELAGG
jgi:CyaY protein